MSAGGCGLDLNEWAWDVCLQRVAAAGRVRGCWLALAERLNRRLCGGGAGVNAIVLTSACRAGLLAPLHTCRSAGAAVCRSCVRDPAVGGAARHLPRL